jgi:hypothetical protein
MKRPLFEKAAQKGLRSLARGAEAARAKLTKFFGYFLFTKSSLPF